jgi:hypothetical protein
LSPDVLRRGARRHVCCLNRGIARWRGRGLVCRGLPRRGRRHLLLLGLQLGYGRLFRLPLLMQGIQLMARLILAVVERGEFPRTLCDLRLQPSRLPPQRIGSRMLVRLIIRRGWRREGR